MRVLLLTPPMTQLNTPYPATAYLTGFLRAHASALDLVVTQADPALSLFLRLFEPGTVARIAEILTERARGAGRGASMPAPIAHFLRHASVYVDTVGPATRFLQGRYPRLAVRILWRASLPERSRFGQRSPRPSAVVDARCS